MRLGLIIWALILLWTQGVQAADHFAVFYQLEARFLDEGQPFRDAAQQEWDKIPADAEPSIWIQHYLLLEPLGLVHKDFPGSALRKKALQLAAQLADPDLDLWLRLIHLEDSIVIHLDFEQQKKSYEELLQKAEDQKLERVTMPIIQSFAGFLYTNGEMKRALDICNRGMSRLSQNPKARFLDSVNMRAMLGMIFRELNDHRKSNEVFEALLLEIRSSPYRNLYMETLYNYANRSEDLEKSVKAMQEVIRLAQQNKYPLLESLASRSLGSSYTLLKQNDKALVALNNALAIMERENLANAYRVTALRNRSDVQTNLKNWQAAIADAENAQKITPAHDDYSQKMGEISLVNAYRGLEDFEKTAQHLGKLLALTEKIYQREKAEEMNKLTVNLGLKLEEEKSAKLQETIQAGERRKKLLTGLLGVGALSLILLLFALAKSRTAQQKQAQLQRITQHVHEGIINIRSSQKVESHISPHIAGTLAADGKVPRDKKLLALLWERGGMNHDEIHLIEQILETTIGESLETWSFNSGNLPAEINIEASQKILALDWHPMPTESGQVQSILLAIRDITDRRMLERVVNRAEQKAQLFATRIQEIQATPIQLAHDLLARLSHCLEYFPKHPDEIPSLKRELHLIKGIARSLGWRELRELVHDFEDELIKSEAERDMESIWNRLDASGRQYREVFDILHGGVHQGLSSLHPHLIEVVAAQYQNFSGQLKLMQVPLGSFVLEDKFCTWDEVPREVLDTLLVHGISNALDHGFMRPIQAGKLEPRPCHLKISSEIRGKNLRLTIEDNGYGIDLHALRLIAEKRQLKFSDDQELIDLLLLDGVSTAERVSQSSGRGVGLAAIANLARSYEGRVQLLPNTDQGITLALEIPLQRLVKTQHSAA